MHKYEVRQANVQQRGQWDTTTLGDSNEKEYEYYGYSIRVSVDTCLQASRH